MGGVVDELQAWLDDPTIRQELMRLHTSGEIGRYNDPRPEEPGTRHTTFNELPKNA